MLDIDFNSISSAKIDPVNWPPMDKITLFISSIFLHFTIKLKGPKTSFFSWLFFKKTSPSMEPIIQIASFCLQIINPGLVQNWPTPNVIDPISKSIVLSFKAESKSKTGLTLPISAKKGIGSSLSFAILCRIIPAFSEPVKPPALISWCLIKFCPTNDPEPCNKEKTPSGIPHFFAASIIASPIRELVPGWEPCAFTINVLPAANADAESPPAVEYANGKLLAANTTTGPKGCNFFLKSGFGIGLRDGSAKSIDASTQEPSLINSANNFSWPTVLPLSPIILCSVRAVSFWTLLIRLSPRSMILSAIVSRKYALSFDVTCLYKLKASFDFFIA